MSKIRIEDYTERSSLGYVWGDSWEKAERDALEAMVDAFASEMKKKLIAKMEEGYGGWANDSSRLLLQRKLEEHVSRGEGQWVDVANLACFLWNLED